LSRAKAEALIKRLDKKLKKQQQKWAFKTAKKARAWRINDRLQPMYVVDKPGSGHFLKQA